MKKNVIIILAIVLAIVLVFILVSVGVFISKSSKNNNKIQNSNNYGEYGQDIDLNDDFSKNEATYNSDFLEKLDDLEDLDGKIIDIKNSGNDLYACTNNKLYRYDYGGFEEVLNSTKTIKSMFLIGYNIVVLQNSDNSYSVYGKSYQSSSLGISSSFKEIKGIEAENIIYAMDSDNSNKIILIRDDDNSYYIDMYELDANQNIKSKELKVPLHLSLGMNNSKEVSNIKQIYVENESKLIFTLSDGRVYETGFGISFSDVSNGYIKLYMQGTDVEDLSNVNKVYGKGSVLKYRRPLFEKLGDKNNLYTYNSEVPISSVGTPDEQYKISISLPNGHTTSDIKSIVFDENLLVECNDNSIYIAEKGNLSKLLYNEELSSLNKNGKIIKIDLNNSDFVALMDDNCIYEIDI